VPRPFIIFALSDALSAAISDLICLDALITVSASLCDCVVLVAESGLIFGAAGLGIFNAVDFCTFTGAGFKLVFACTTGLGGAGIERGFVFTTP